MLKFKFIFLKQFQRTFCFLVKFLCIMYISSFQVKATLISDSFEFFDHFYRSMDVLYVEFKKSLILN